MVSNYTVYASSLKEVQPNPNLVQFTALPSDLLEGIITQVYFDRVQYFPDLQLSSPFLRLTFGYFQGNKNLTAFFCTEETHIEIRSSQLAHFSNDFKASSVTRRSFSSSLSEKAENLVEPSHIIQTGTRLLEQIASLPQVQEEYLIYRGHLALNEIPFHSHLNASRRVQRFVGKITSYFP